MTGLDLCYFCHKSLPYNHSCCYRCAAPLTLSAIKRQQLTGQQLVCGRCLALTDGIDHSIVPFLYRPPIDFMIKRLKFSEQMKFSRLLGDLLTDAIERFYTDESSEHASGFPDIIVPMPTHRDRLLQRGFNQAQEIATVVANRFCRKCDINAVTRSVSRQPQSGLNAARREANIRQSFAIPNPEAINALHVAVVDDVYTTGATARAITRKLKSAGATKVSIWAVARTP